MKKEVRIIKTALIVLLSIIVICLSLFACYYFKGKKTVNDIAKIEVITGGYLRSTSNYTVDFISNEISCVIDKEVIIETYSSAIDENKKELFVSKANLYGMFQWKELYKPNETVYDGQYTEIYITYSDGSNQEILCSNEYPITYDKMQEVFYEAFGYNML